MSSQFKNSSLGFYLYTFLIVIIVAAVVFVFWFMIAGYKLGTYDENTLLGSVYVGGRKQDEVEDLMTTRIDRWLGDETILFEVKYQGYSYTIDRELFDFDLVQSTSNIQNGKTNQLEVYYLGSKEENIISEMRSLVFLEEINENIDYEQIINDVLKDAALMKSFSVKNIEDYFINKEEDEVVLATETLHIPNSINISDFMESISNVYEDGALEIPRDYYFDIIDELGEEMNDDELGFLSSSMLSLILETNFSINEVHYENKIDLVNYNIDTFPYYGINSIIFERENKSFSFYNPNETGYHFEFIVDGEELTINLYGLEFVNEIEAELQIQLIDHITKVTQNDQDVQTGVDGVVVEVVRTITDLNGNEIYEMVVVSEFYPPEVEIVLNQD